MTREASGLDRRAIALLRPRLDEGETLLWAERPHPLRMAIFSTRTALLQPTSMIVMFLFAGIVTWSITNAGSPASSEISPFMIGGIVVLCCAAQLVLCLFAIVLFFTPVAYGATSGYFLILRGLIARRLLRTPISLVTNVRVLPWAGSDAIVFDMVEGQKTAFAFLHTKQPTAALNTLRAIVASAKISS